MSEDGWKVAEQSGFWILFKQYKDVWLMEVIKREKCIRFCIMVIVCILSDNHKHSRMLS